MLFWSLYSRGNKNIWLKVPGREAVETKITEVENNLIWISLPRQEGQVIVLKQHDDVEIGFSFSEGYYCATTEVVRIGSSHGKVYGLAIPERFERQQRRDYVRSKYSGTALFTSLTQNTGIATEIFDFSAGGLKVFVTPEFEKILAKEKNFHVVFAIDSIAFSLKASLVWVKQKDEILYAGFKFNDLHPKDENILMALALKYSRKDAGNR
ncbi:hypothetical protein JCM39194_15220 [Desulfotomaculum varum]